MRDTKSALKWIVQILESKDVKFNISGGFAAKIYGSHRRLADIDIDVKQTDIKRLLPSISKYIVYGPSKYVDKHWDIPIIVTLRYKGQTIDIFGADRVKIYDASAKSWVSYPYSRNNKKKLVFGIAIPVIDKGVLIAYKSKLLRGVDRSDINELSPGTTHKHVKTYKLSAKK
ncbi:MAG: hypothetical protein QW814_01845 [Methanothrix sp.]